MSEATLHEAYERDGFVRVPGTLSANALNAMRTGLLKRIAKLEFVENAGALRPAVGTEPELWEVGREQPYASLPATFMTAVNQVFGVGVWTHVEGEQGGFAMPNLPCPATPWSPCSEAWHVDEPSPPTYHPSDVLIGFICLDKLAPGGGATVALAGSTRRLALLAEQLGTPCTTDIALHHLAREESWFSTLFQPGHTTQEKECFSAGIALSLQELTGDPGDVLLMNPRCLHTLSANVSPRARLIMRMTGVRV